ncbi:MAG: beta-N-acetylhexosaminidase [Candidatus Omnitrophota bacterium]
MRNRFIQWTILIAALGGINAESANQETIKEDVMKEEISIIPQPMSLKKTGGAFTLDRNAVIQLDSSGEDIAAIGGWLGEWLSNALGSEIPVLAANAVPANAKRIVLSIEEKNEPLGEEGYELTVSTQTILLRANRPAGLFYAVQTLRQLLPPSFEKSGAAAASCAIPGVEIEDRPQYRWRGALLDCARHFMTKDFLLRYIDLLAYHKLNVFHLHLTDDQGWRIEIEKHPKLMEVGAYRMEGNERYGGYYSKKDLREIIAYAQARFITVIPEFEMPGHASAAIASYPELACDGQSISVLTEWGVFKNVFCAGKEGAFDFLESVLDEIIDIFPSPYIHIGGDEAPRDHWQECPLCQKRIQEEHLKSEAELQSYLIRRIEKFLSSRGRRMIGWDEILEGGGLPPSAIVQSWRGMDGAVTASKLGHDVVSSPNPFVYFDYPQEEKQVSSKPDWMILTTMEKTYSFRATPPELTPDEAKHVLGAECALWTEHSPQEQVDQQTFPRLCAYSETVWTPEKALDWQNFQKRITPHLERLAALGVDYYR